jgi:hypothetical protein
MCCCLHYISHCVAATASAAIAATAAAVVVLKVCGLHDRDALNPSRPPPHLLPHYGGPHTRHWQAHCRTHRPDATDPTTHLSLASSATVCWVCLVACCSVYQPGHNGCWCTTGWCTESVWWLPAALPCVLARVLHWVCSCAKSGVWLLVCGLVGGLLCGPICFLMGFHGPHQCIRMT